MNSKIGFFLHFFIYDLKSDPEVVISYDIKTKEHFLSMRSRKIYQAAKAAFPIRLFKINKTGPFIKNGYRWSLRIMDYE